MSGHGRHINRRDLANLERLNFLGFPPRHRMKGQFPGPQESLRSTPPFLGTQPYNPAAGPRIDSSVDMPGQPAGEDPFDDQVIDTTAVPLLAD